MYRASPPNHGQSGLDWSVRSQLEKAKRNVPRYLFRTFSDRSGGGAPGLNSTSSVIPHGFLKDRTPRSPYNMTRAKMGDMAWSHLCGGYGSSEFSSWSATPILAFSYANSKYRYSYETGVHVAILDTFSANTSNAWHVPDLLGALGKPRGYDHEYLVHGIIAGDGYKAVPFDAMIKAGVYSFMPGLGSGDWFGTDYRHLEFKSMTLGRALTQESMAQIVKIARLFEPFECAAAAALVCAHKRPWQNESEVDAETIRIFKEGLGKLNIEPEWYGDRYLLGDKVYTKNYPEIKQWLVLLRSIKNSEYGRGRRTAGRAMQG